jgi:large subunit GTPase 1
LFFLVILGYPNVGKSSTMNALVGAKKCSVGSTPGKTKHFQTIHISDSMILCDCPGLVFPSFATTKADMVVNGVLPIDQLREVQGPAGLVAQRIPKYYLEAIYGINIKTRNVEGELVCRTPTASEFLCAYAIARGYTKASQGNPDESRAARYILKDYVGGKLLYIQPPPGINAKDFNAEMYENKQLLERQIKMNKIEALQTKIQSETTETELSKNDRRVYFF